MAFLVGVGVASRVMGESLFYYLAWFVAGLMVAVGFTGFASRRRGDAVFWIVLIALLVGGLRVWVDWQMDAAQREAKVYGLVVRVGGEVVTQPVVKNGKQSFYLRADSVSTGMLMRVSLADLPELHWRDKVLLSGTLVTPENTESFNYADYLMKDHVYWVLDRASLITMKAAGGDYGSVLWWLMWIRGGFLEKVYEVYGEPAGGIVAGLLIGEKANIESGILKDFQTTGLTHILAISGFNISLIINIISFMVAKRGKWNRYIVTMSLISAFVVITGASASVLRAAVMGGMVLTVKTLGRSSQILKIILLSGVLLVMINPRILDFDISFQLSFFATMSLILYADRIEKLFAGGETEDDWKLSKWQRLGSAVRNFIKDGILTTLAAQVMTLPIIFYSFGTISLISPLANLLVGPLIPAIMFCGFVAVMLGFLNVFVAGLVGGVATMLINLMLWIVSTLARFPMASLSLGKGEVWLAILYYLAVIIVFHRRKSALDSAPVSVLPDR